MKLNRSTALSALLVFAALATPALAHPGHDAGGIVSGLLHPLSGVDHLVTMLAIGMWAVQLGKKAKWIVPASFVAFMVAGAGLAFTGLHFAPTGVDQAIAASALVLGLIVAGAFRLPVWSGAALAAVFGLFNGYAHGSELHVGTSALTFSLGFTAATIMLMIAGFAIATALSAYRKPSAIRFAGFSVAMMAILLLAGVI